MEQLGVDPLNPGRALIDQCLVEANLEPGLENLRGWDPRLRDRAGVEQLTKMPGVELIGLGPLLRAAQRGSVSGLSNVRIDPGRLELFDHEPPAGATLERERSRLIVKPTQPMAHLDARRWRNLAAADLTASGVEIVEGDLPSVHVESPHNRHDRLLTSGTGWRIPALLLSGEAPRALPTHAIYVLSRCCCRCFGQTSDGPLG
jgi:hypothetical protein